MIRSSIERALAALGVALCVATVTSLAPGQGAPPPDPKEMARALGEEGLALHAAGRFVEAFEKFATAERIQHSPVLVLWMARAKRGTGALLDALALYQRVAEEALSRDASDKWRNAQSAARTEVVDVRARIPTLVVRVAAREAATAVVRVDGRQVRLDEPVLLDPGDHVVRVSVAGAAPIERGVRLTEGRREMVDVAFGQSPPDDPKGSIVPGVVVLAGGLAAMTAGAITGVLALDLAGDVEDGCVQGHCLPEDEGKADDATALGVASTALLVGGGIASAVGVALLVLRPGGVSREAVAFSVGPAAVRAQLRF